MDVMFIGCFDSSHWMDVMFIGCFDSSHWIDARLKDGLDSKHWILLDTPTIRAATCMLSQNTL